MPVVSLDNTITLALSVRDRHASADWYAENSDSSCSIIWTKLAGASWQPEPKA